VASTATGDAQSKALESASSLSTKLNSATSALASATSAGRAAGETQVPILGALALGALGLLI
jgi:hypothetical protein